MTAVAAIRRPRALILQSTFTSLDPIAWQFWVPPLFMPDRFDNEGIVRALDVPVLVLHGEQDEIFPVAQARALAAAAKDGTLDVYRCGHNDCDQPRFWADIQPFLERALK